jgi:predicted DCC family thiol-disulfide oxidoreductase YuxK
MPAIRKLCVLYDVNCGLCTGVRDWLLSQSQLVPLDLLPCGSPEARARFPGIPPGELAVISDTGDAWLGNSAWIICLWALRDYREWSFTLARPLLLPLARQAFAAVSRNRLAVARLLHMRDRAAETELRTILVTGCETRQD